MFQLTSHMLSSYNREGALFGICTQFLLQSLIAFSRRVKFYLCFLKG